MAAKQGRSKEGQSTGNACATVAMLNILLNISDLNLGPNLQNFKDFTTTFTPALRGAEVINFEYVKQIHNSFAK